MLLLVLIASLSLLSLCSSLDDDFTGAGYVYATACYLHASQPEGRISIIYPPLACMRLAFAKRSYDIVR